MNEVQKFEIIKFKEELILFKDKKDKLTKLNTQAKALSDEIKEKETELAKTMREVKLNSYPIEGVGNFKAVVKTEVYNPSKIEDKTVLFASVREILGATGFLNKVSIPHVTLQGMISKMQEEIKRYLEKNKIEGIPFPNEDEQNKADSKLKEAEITDNPVRKEQLIKEAQELKEKHPYLLPGIKTTAIKYKLSITKK